MHCDLFKIYCAPPNLDITRTWICRLNFAERPIFSGFRFFNEPEISTRDPQLKVSPGGLVLRIFTSWKNPSTSAAFELANLGSRGEHVTPKQTGQGLVTSDCKRTCKTYCKLESNIILNCILRMIYINLYWIFWVVFMCFFNLEAVILIQGRES